MMEYINPKLIKETEFFDLDRGHISLYQKEGDTLILKSQTCFSFNDGKFKFNQLLPPGKIDIHKSRVYFGKKGEGLVFSCSFADFVHSPNTIRYCYEMEQVSMITEEELGGFYR